MSRRHTLALAASMAAAAGIGGVLALTVPASAGTAGGGGGYPTPTVSATITPTVAPPTATPTPPVVNPFARCHFTRTLQVTFDPGRGHDVFEVVPSITCDGPRRTVQVYTLAELPRR